MKQLIIFVILIFLVISVVPAIDLSGAAGQFGVAIIINDTELGTINPVITNTLGGSVQVDFKKGFWLGMHPSIDVYWYNYELYNGIAVPTEQERSEDNNAFVLGFLLDIPLSAKFKFNDQLGGFFSIGPAFSLRASIAYSDSDISKENIQGIVNYFWEKGRWFFPSSSLRFDLYLEQGFMFSLGGRAFFPIYNLWTEADNFWNEFIGQITMSMSVIF